MQERTKKIKLLIIGAGKAGQLIAKNLKSNKTTPFQVVGFIDDSDVKQGQEIQGLKVLGKTSDIREVMTESGAEEILIAIPSERGEIVRKIIENTIGLKVGYKILPRQSEVLFQKYSEDYLQYIRNVKAEDLLGGEIVKSDQELIAQNVKNHTFLITGAAGSIGSELSRQIASYGAKKVIFYDWWENGMFELQNQLAESKKDNNFEFIIGDIKDRARLDLLMDMHKPDFIFHAAAYKHVPLMEHNPAEAIKSNILGTRTVAELAIKHKVKKFVLVSSDKAVNPTNVMGATKRAAEKIIHILSESQNSTIFCAVRFGNVINSNGSVIPTFYRQIEKGGPVTVTHKDINRFFMTIPEAVHLILQAWIIGKNNDLFVLDMGEPIRIYDLARLLIAIHGYVPEDDIKIEIIGLRPGEKINEEILVDAEETQATSLKKIYMTKNYMNFDRLAFLMKADLLIESLKEDGLDPVTLKQSLKELVSTYSPKLN